MTANTTPATLGWDDVTMYRLWQEADVPVRKILKHLHCYPDREEPAANVAEYVGASASDLTLLVNWLERTCEERFGRPLPFTRRDVGGAELYCMPRAVTAMVHVVY